MNADSSAPRARDLGVPFEGTPGPLNAITDVAGVEVGHVTLIEGDGSLRVGHGPVRTGVTAIHPRGRAGAAPVFAGWFSLNGNGEMTGTAWIDEAGILDGPILLTNTNSVGTARDAALTWLIRRAGEDSDPATQWFLPVVTETWDGTLNDINGFHVKPEHVFAALDSARGGPVAEGNVGGGTGMICYEFKGGIGTASRVVACADARYTLGALVQANHGLRHQLRIAGVPVGLEIPVGRERAIESEAGSIIIILATDAPLLPHQLKALARRAALGLARTGAVAAYTSGDLLLAFSTANAEAVARPQTTTANILGSDHLTPMYEATVQAVEEAIVNALVAARTISGINGYTVEALLHEQLQKTLRKYNRLPRTRELRR